MRKKGPTRKAFEVLCEIARESYQKREESKSGPGIYHSVYNDLLFTVNNLQGVLDNSNIMHDGRQLRQRMGIADNETLTLYRNDIIRYLMILAEKKEGKKEVDGAIIVDERGKLRLEYGTREIMSSPQIEAKLKKMRGRMVSGTGRRALQRISTLPYISGFMMSEKTFEVMHYANGRMKRSYDVAKDVVIRGSGKKSATPYDKYKF